MIFFLFLAGCSALVLFGAGTAAGIAGYKWYEGALTVIYEAPYIEAWEGTLKALEKMELEMNRELAEEFLRKGGLSDVLAILEKTHRENSMGYFWTNA